MFGQSTAVRSIGVRMRKQFAAEHTVANVLAKLGRGTQSFPQMDVFQQWRRIAYKLQGSLYRLRGHRNRRMPFAQNVLLICLCTDNMQGHAKLALVRSLVSHQLNDFDNP